MNLGRRDESSAPREELTHGTGRSSDRASGLYRPAACCSTFTEAASRSGVCIRKVGGYSNAAQPQPRRKPSAISGQPETTRRRGDLCTLIGWPIPAQGRDRRERTLGQRPVRERTLNGFHTEPREPSCAGGQPFQDWRPPGRFPRVRSCVAILGWGGQLLRGTERLLALEQLCSERRFVT